MAKKFLTHIDLNQNQLQNAQLDPRTGAPSSPVEGQIYYNSQQKKFFICTDDGTQAGHSVQWDTWGASGGNAFGRITVGSTNIDADNNSDTLTISAGSGISLTPNATNDSLQIACSVTNTDTKVKQTSDTAGSAYPILISAQASPSSGTAYEAKYAPNAKIKTGSSPTMTLDGTNYYGFGGSIADGNNSFVTGDTVYEYVSTMSGPMKYVGTVGTNGNYTWTQFAAQIADAATAAANVGHTFKVITANTSTYGAKVGDLIVVTDTSPYYSVIPSGDEPSGTVTSITAGAELTGGTISSSGTIAHATKLGSNYTKTASASSGGTFTLKIPNISVNTYGHVTSASDETVTVTMPAVSEQISRANGTISTSSTSCEISIGSSRTIYAVTAISDNAGVVVDWSYNSSTGKVTASVVSAPSAAVTVNVLYYGGGTVPSAVQADYVVDWGTDNYWTWRKWDSGWAEAWGHFDTTFPAGTTNNRYGNMPKVSGSTQLFVYDPVINANVWMEQTASATVQFTEASVTRDQWTVYIQTTAGSGDKNTWIYLHLMGRWKTL